MTNKGKLLIISVATLAVATLFIHLNRGPTKWQKVDPTAEDTQSNSQTGTVARLGLSTSPNHGYNASVSPTIGSQQKPIGYRTLLGAISSTDIPTTIGSLAISQDNFQGKLGVALDYWCHDMFLVKDGMIEPIWREIEKNSVYKAGPENIKRTIQNARNDVESWRRRCGRATQGLLSGHPEGFKREIISTPDWEIAYLTLTSTSPSKSGLDNLSDQEARKTLQALIANPHAAALAMVFNAHPGLKYTPIMDYFPNDHRRDLRAHAVMAIAACTLVPELCAQGTITYAAYCIRTSFMFCLSDRIDDSARLLFNKEQGQLNAAAQALLDALSRGDRSAFLRPKSPQDRKP